MILETGTVDRVHDGYAWVVCAAQAGCSRCAEGRGCGAGLLGRLLGDRLHRVRALPGSQRLQAGDRVELALSESALLKGAAVAYGLPLLGLVGLPLMLLAVAGIDGDGPQLLAAVTGLLLGLLASRRISTRIARLPGFQPTVTRRLSAGCRPAD